MHFIFMNIAFVKIAFCLMFNRQGLDILIHLLVDDEFDDHTSNALCLVNPFPLNL